MCKTVSPCEANFGKHSYFHIVYKLVEYQVVASEVKTTTLYYIYRAVRWGVEERVVVQRKEVGGRALSWQGLGGPQEKILAWRLGEILSSSVCGTSKGDSNLTPPWGLTTVLHKCTLLHLESWQYLDVTPTHESTMRHFDPHTMSTKTSDLCDNLLLRHSNPVTFYYCDTSPRNSI